MTNYDILYNYFLDQNTKLFNDVKADLDAGRFDDFNNNYFIKVEYKSIPLDSDDLMDNIKQITDVINNKLPNQVDFKLGTNIWDLDTDNFCNDDVQSVITYVQYSMIDFSKVESSCRYSAKGAVFKLGISSNSKEVERYMKIINDFHDKNM